MDLPGYAECAEARAVTRPVGGVELRAPNLPADYLGKLKFLSGWHGLDI